MGSKFARIACVVNENVAIIYYVGICPHLKLWVALATHNVKWLKNVCNLMSEGLRQTILSLSVSLDNNDNSSKGKEHFYVPNWTQVSPLKPTHKGKKQYI